jgi:beta-alanine--pyruvate transaminase
MTIAKALTNGSIPMGGVVASEKVYKTITEAAPETGIEFFHGYTYSAHPAACAAGIATLDIYENDGLFKKSAEMEDYFLDQLFAMRDADIVTDIRGIGLLGAFDMAPRDGTPGVRGGQAVKDFYNAGVLVKMTGDTVIVAPPFVADKADIDKMFDIIRGVVAKL